MSSARRGAQAAAEMLMAPASVTPRLQQQALQRAQSPMIYRPPSAQSHTTVRPLSSWSERSTARPSTAGCGIGLNTEVKVDSRPVTQQGMMSMRTPFQGPGRQILDKSYFLGKLRAKKQELQTEMDSMTTEIECLKKKAPTNIQLDSHQDALLKEVKVLKAQLGDYNTVMENVAAGLDFEQLKDTLKPLKEKVDKERKKIDQLFTERSQKEKATKILEENYLSLVADLEQKLEQDGPEARAKFIEIRQENELLIDEVDKLESTIEELTRCIEPLEQDLSKAAPERQRAVMLMKQLLTAEEELQQMRENDTSLVHRSPEDSREAILCKMRQGNAEIAQAEEKSRELEVEIKLCQEQVDAAEMELIELRGGRAEKFMEMQQKEKKMQAFLDSYPTLHQEHTTAMQLVQQKILLLLEHTSQVDSCDYGTGIHSHNLSEGNSKDAEEVMRDMEVRRAQLKQLKEIESKIGNELTASKQKMASLKTDLEKYTCMDEVRIGSELKCLKLEAQKKTIEEQTSLVQMQLNQQTTLLESMQCQLNESNLHENIENLNQKLLTLQSNILKTQEELEMKERELNYKPVLENICFMVCQLNGEIRSNLNTIP